VKPWYTSRTFWLNLTVLGIGAAADNVAQLNGLLPVSIFKIVSFGLPVLNIGMRFITTQALTAGRAS
jgi:hypothetical protein